MSQLGPEVWPDHAFGGFARSFRSAINPCLTFGEQAVDDTGQVAGHRLNGFGAAQPGGAKIPIGSHAQDATQHGFGFSPGCAGSLFRR